MVGEEKRHQMMQNLFGDQSEEEEEEEVESEHESNPQPGYASDEGDGGLKPEGESEAEVDGQGEPEVESEGELHADLDVEESEGERDQDSHEVEAADQREESEGKEVESDEKEGYTHQRVSTSRRRDLIDSASDRSEENHYADNEDDEVNQDRGLSRSPREERGGTQISDSAHEIRDVFGDSDEEEPAPYTIQNNAEDDSNRSPMEEEGSYGRDVRPEEIVPDEDVHYESEEENIETKSRERPVGPPLDLEIPLRPPPARQDKMNMIKVSNIMGIDPKPFDPKTFVEEDVFVPDESGSKKRIRLDNNTVRWRIVKKPDGTKSYESNARFVRWSDGSLQLLIGNEVLDISVQDAQHDQAHLFLRHGKGMLQSQGRLLRKMRFMPSSLSSNSHKLLTALVDSRHRKVYKVKNCVTDIDPEREKEQKERAETQTIRASEQLSRKKEKVKSKYTPTVRRERKLSPGFLEDDPLDEDDEPDYYDRRRSAGRNRFDEEEARAEKRIINAKRGQKDIPHRSSQLKSSRQPVDFSESEEEEAEYETEEEEEEERPPRRKRAEEPEEDEEEEEEEHQQYDEEEEEANDASEEEPEEEPKQRGRDSGRSFKRKEIESDEEDSPPRKTAAPPHRRKAVVLDSDDED